MSRPKGYMKKFVSYYKPYKGLFIADVSCAMLATLIALTIPLLVRHITGTLLPMGEGAVPEVFKIGALMLGLILVQTGCAFFFDAKGHHMGAMMERDMRGELFAHCQRMDFSFFDHRKTGELMSRITNDLLTLTELYHHGPEDLMIHFVKFIGSVVILLNVNARLTGIVLAFLPVMILYALFFNRKLKVAYRDSRERIADVNAQVEDNLNGIRVVQSFANEAVEEEKFSRQNERFLNSRKRIYSHESYYFTGLQYFFAQIITVAVVVFGAAAIARQTLGLTDLITFLLYVGYLVEPIPQLARIVQQYQEGLSGFDRFWEILNTEPSIQDRPNAQPLQDVQGDIAFEDVGFRYDVDGEYVFRHFSMRVRAGETVALVGSSGVGKTTLCSLIPRFYDSTEGRILLDGIDVKDVRLQSLRQNIGVVQQEVYLFTGTVMENILYGKPGASSEEVVQAAKRANAHQFIMELPNGYDTDIGQRGVRLSGGQRQRLSIARVFLKNPSVLIFDEATSALDNQSERIVQESLGELSKGRTTLVIAHRLSTVRRADRIVVLSEQGIEQQGSHQELLDKGGIYARLYNMQFEMD